MFQASLLLVILMVKKIAATFYEKELQKTNQGELKM